MRHCFSHLLEGVGGGGVGMRRNPEDGTWDHGGDLPRSERSRNEILDASTTVNPFGPSFSLNDAIGLAGERWTFYPDPWSRELVRGISGCLHIPSDCLVPGPGATALIYRWMEVVRPRRLILFEPVFSEYPRAARLFGVPCRIITGCVPLPFSGKPPSTASQWGADIFSGFPVEAGDWVVVVNPVNPTGQCFPAIEMEELSNRLARWGAGLLVDESFQDFLGNRDSLLSRVGEDNRFLAVVRSLTKVTGLPGIRTGWLAGDRETVDKTGKSLGPWSVGALESVVMEQYYRSFPSDFSRIKNARERLSSFLSKKGYPVARGEAPFIFLHTGWGKNAFRIRDEVFHKKGVFLRVADGFGPVSGVDYLRLGFEAFSKPQLIEELFLDLI